MWHILLLLSLLIENKVESCCGLVPPFYDPWRTVKPTFWTIWTFIYSSGLCRDWKQPDGDTERTEGFCHHEEQREGHRHVHPQVLFLAGLQHLWYCFCLLELLEHNPPSTQSLCCLVDFWTRDDTGRAVWGHSQKPNVWFPGWEECADIQLWCNKRWENLHHSR